MQKLLDSFTHLNTQLSKQIKAINELQCYIADLKNCITVFCEKLSNIKKYVTIMQNILTKIIDILKIIIQYLKKNN